MRICLLACLSLLLIACDGTPASPSSKKNTSDKSPSSSSKTHVDPSPPGADEGMACAEQRECKFGLQCEERRCTDPRRKRICKAVARRQGFSDPQPSDACLIFIERIKQRLDDSAFDRFANCARDKASVHSFPDCIPSGSERVTIKELNKEVVNVQLNRLTQAVQAYQKEHSTPPKDIDTLIADKRVTPNLLDPWGKRFRLSIAGTLITVESSGPDLTFGSDDDIVKRVVF